jgi:hypothetical protein
LGLLRVRRAPDSDGGGCALEGSEQIALRAQGWIQLDAFDPEQHRSIEMLVRDGLGAKTVCYCDLRRSLGVPTLDNSEDSGDDRPCKKNGEAHKQHP